MAPAATTAATNAGATASSSTLSSSIMPPSPPLSMLLPMLLACCAILLLPPPSLAVAAAFQQQPVLLPTCKVHERAAAGAGRWHRREPAVVGPVTAFETIAASTRRATRIGGGVVPLASSTDATAAAGAAAPEQLATDTAAAEEEVGFASDRMHVYIEDTDAYGVMYNANYLRAYERALHVASVRPPSYVRQSAAAAAGRDDKGDGELPLVRGGALDHAGWFVGGVTKHKFKGSPPLGGEFVVEGTLLSRDCPDDGSSSESEGGCVETWRVEMRDCPAPPDNDGNDSKQEKATVYNSAEITLSSPSDLSARRNPPPLPALEEGGSTVRSTYTPYRDEFDPTLPHHMPLRNVLNLFERARSDYLGGPDGLRRMQEEDNVVWVVTGVDDCELVNLAAAGSWEEEEDDGGDEEEEVDVLDDEEEEGEGSSAGAVGPPSSSWVRCRPGHDVTVRTSFGSRRGGMVLECRQTLLVPVWDDAIGSYRNRRLAQGVVTIKIGGVSN